MEPVGRNQPCPCGSGKRYKECHGLMRNAASEPVLVASLPAARAERALREAERCLDSGDVDAAETSARATLATAPTHVDALRLLGRCECQRGHHEEAVRLLLTAARANDNGTLGAGKQYKIWIDLNFALMRALSGLDGAFAAAKRAEYARWLVSLSELRRDATPRVSIVVLAGADSSWLRLTLASIHAQTYRNLELVIVHADADRTGAGAISNLLTDCPFPYALVPHGPAEQAALLNDGVRASSGEFVNVLAAGDEFSPGRISTFIEEVANRGCAWGFGDMEFVEADLSADASAQARVARWREMLDGVPDLDTVGHAFIAPDCVAVTPGNLFFSRSLFDRLGGFSELPHTHLWDFCLRALWLEEPCYVASPLLRHRVVSSTVKQRRSAYEAAQVEMFGRFYEQACDEQAVAPNRYAPCVHHWRAHFLRVPFYNRHVVILGLDRIEQIAALLSRTSATQRPRELVAGVNLVGLAFAELGIGENLRAFARACAAGGVPFMMKDVPQPLKTRQADHSLVHYIADEPRYRCSLYCVNPDLMPSVHGLLADAAAAGGYAIGYWYWELDRIPREDWEDALARVDEVWVATEFVAAALRSASTKPIVKIPPPIEVRLSRRFGRSEFALPEDRFLYLFSFDYNSYLKRKNPEAAIAAFQRAFPGRGDVGLILKSINGKRYPQRFAEMRELAGGDDRIVMLDGFLTREQVSGLQSVVDAFVSLHRSEGLGLGLAESMYQGKPTIATRYSGNLEFMNDENSCLVDCELVQVGRGEYRYHDERFRWAEPDVEQAAHFMRRLVDDAPFRDRIAQAGQQAIRTRFTPEITAALVRQRLGALGLL